MEKTDSTRVQEYKNSLKHDEEEASFILHFTILRLSEVVRVTRSDKVLNALCSIQVRDTVVAFAREQSYEQSSRSKDHSPNPSI